MANVMSAALLLKGRVLFSTLLGVFLLFGSCAYAARYDGPMRFSTYSPCDGNGSSCGLHVLAEGTIQSDTAIQFQQFLDLPRSRTEQLPPTITVAFDSPGGSVQGGLMLGRLIRAMKMDTVLKPEYDRVNWDKKDRYETFLKGARCASACVFSFAGGVGRMVDANAKMGVHQFAGVGQDIGDAKTQVTVVQLASYLVEMGVNRELLDIGSLVPASTIYWLTQEKLTSLRLDNTRPPFSSWVLKASPDGLPYLTILQEYAQGKKVQVGFVKSGNRVSVAIVAAFDSRVVGQDRIDQFPVGQKTETNLLVDGLRIKISLLSAWTRTDRGESVSFRTFGSIAFSEAKAVSASQNFAIDDNFPTAISDLSFGVKLGNSNLGPGLALVLRAN